MGAVLAEDVLPAEGARELPGTAFALESRFERLVTRVLEGVCVPFLGAGISLSAPSTTSNPPTLNATHIAENLAKTLYKHLQEITHVGAEHPMRRLRDLLLACARMNEDGKLKKDSLPADRADIKSFLTPSLGEVAELCWSVLTPIKTCEVLELERWDEFSPTAAHHYLAVLVREGLITEVLETNYDEFVEMAVKETFGSDVSKKDEIDSAAPVISNLESYRNHIASPRSNRQRRALVKVVKLNGCAAAYRRAVQDDGTVLPSRKEHDRDSAARQIILTEEQLQGWGDKNWARELLNDRVRSRTLLFIGFGNADPIVRHHSVQVIREFQGGRVHATSTVALHEESAHQQMHWRDQKNAPFIAAYDPNLSFYQYQVLRAFRDAHTPQVSGTVSKSQLDDVVSVYSNAFLGGDGTQIAAFVKRESTSPGLPADIFLQALASRCVCLLAREKWFGSNSPLHSYLLGAMSHPRTLLTELTRTLFSGSLTKPAPFVDWLSLKSPSKAEQRASPWATVCFTIRGQDARRGGYRPFIDSPIKQPMLIVLMMLLASRDADQVLRMPSGKEILERTGTLSGSNVAGESAPRIPAYRLVDGDPEKGIRTVFATSKVDVFLLNKSAVLNVRRPEDIIPNHSIVIGLGRGHTNAFRQQIWVEIHGEETSVEGRDAAITPENASKDSTKPPKPGVRVMRELYIIGDLAAIRGIDNQSVDLGRARSNLETLIRSPEVMHGIQNDWRRRYCKEQE